MQPTTNVLSNFFGTIGQSLGSNTSLFFVGCAQCLVAFLQWRVYQQQTKILQAQDRLARESQRAFIQFKDAKVYCKEGGSENYEMLVNFKNFGRVAGVNVKTSDYNTLIDGGRNNIRDYKKNFKNDHLLNLRTELRKETSTHMPVLPEMEFPIKFKIWRDLREKNKALLVGVHISYKNLFDPPDSDPFREDLWLIVDQSAENEYRIDIVDFQN